MTSRRPSGRQHARRDEFDYIRQLSDLDDEDGSTRERHSSRGATSRKAKHTDRPARRVSWKENAEDVHCNQMHQRGPPPAAVLRRRPLSPSTKRHLTARRSAVEQRLASIEHEHQQRTQQRDAQREQARVAHLQQLQQSFGLLNAAAAYEADHHLQVAADLQDARQRWWQYNHQPLESIGLSHHGVDGRTQSYQQQPVTGNRPSSPHGRRSQHAEAQVIKPTVSSVDKQSRLDVHYTGSTPICTSAISAVESLPTQLPAQQPRTTTELLEQRKAQLLAAVQQQRAAAHERHLMQDIAQLEREMQQLQAEQQQATQSLQAEHHDAPIADTWTDDQAPQAAGNDAKQVDSTPKSEAKAGARASHLITSPLRSFASDSTVLDTSTSSSACTSHHTMSSVTTTTSDVLEPAATHAVDTASFNIIVQPPTLSNTTQSLMPRTALQAYRPASASADVYCAVDTATPTLSSWRHLPPKASKPTSDQWLSLLTLQRAQSTPNESSQSGLLQTPQSVTGSAVSSMLGSPSGSYIVREHRSGSSRSSTSHTPARNQWKAAVSHNWHQNVLNALIASRATSSMPAVTLHRPSHHIPTPPIGEDLAKYKPPVHRHNKPTVRVIDSMKAKLVDEDWVVNNGAIIPLVDVADVSLMFDEVPSPAAVTANAPLRPQQLDRHTAATSYELDLSTHRAPALSRLESALTEASEYEDDDDEFSSNYSFFSSPGQAQQMHRSAKRYSLSSRVSMALPIDEYCDEYDDV